MFPKPVFTESQLVPLLVERKTPPPSVPAKRFVPETARNQTLVFVKPVLAAVQLVPLLVERKTAPKVPAKRFVPIATMLLKDVNGVFADVQLVPLFVERWTE